MATKISKAIERKVEKLFSELGSNIQFNFTDLNKLCAPVEALLAAGGTDDAARAMMTANIAKYRQN